MTVRILDDEQSARSRASKDFEQERCRAISIEREQLHRLVNMQRAKLESEASERLEYQLRHQVAAASHEQQLCIANQRLVCGKWRLEYAQHLRDRSRAKLQQLESCRVVFEQNCMLEHDRFSQKCKAVRCCCETMLRESTFLIFGSEQIAPETIRSEIRFGSSLLQLFDVGLAAIRDEFERDLSDRIAAHKARDASIRQQLDWVATESLRLAHNIAQEEKLSWRFEIVRAFGVEKEKTIAIVAIGTKKKSKLEWSELLCRREIEVEMFVEIATIFSLAESSARTATWYLERTLWSFLTQLNMDASIDIAARTRCRALIDTLIRSEVRQRSGLLWAQAQSWDELCSVQLTE